jgi:flagellar motor component MotA
LLSDIAAFPRKAHTDSFFFRGLKTSKADLLAAMDVADDGILRESGTFELEDRCKQELYLLSAIENTPIDAKLRCKLVRRIIEGAPPASIEEELDEERKRETT